MIVAIRTLVWREQSSDVPVAVRVFKPEHQGDVWICRYEIDWPSDPAARWASGHDGIQATVLALQMIGAEIYASSYHRSGRLSWLAPGRGYGFPVPHAIRDLLQGDDRRFF